MNTEQIKSTFLEYFQERGHRRITGSTLIPPAGDPVLYTTSGMHPLTPYLLGRRHPLGKRLVNVQRCLRTTDLDEVGDTTHLTVFEMLGSWSLGNYGLEQSLQWGFELLRDGYGIDPARLHATVFGGDEHLGPDHRSLHTWRRLGVPIELTADDNWWSNGPTGPCGPHSEIFVWTGPGQVEGTPATDERWVEIWNHVLIRYNRMANGSLEPLPQTSIDTGMGLERLVTVLQGKKSVFETDGFAPWTTGLPHGWDLDTESRRVVIDHLRSSVVIAGDGVRPSNTTRGYVLRRLLRRTLTTLWPGDPSRTLSDLPPGPILHTLDHFELSCDLTSIRDLLQEEERSFRQLVERGRSIVGRHLAQGPLTDDDFSYLHDTHGLPRELVVNLLEDLSEPPPQ